jgi:hypothetical protein
MSRLQVEDVGVLADMPGAVHELVGDSLKFTHLLVCQHCVDRDVAVVAIGSELRFGEVE